MQLYYFTAPWCVPCKTLRPVMEAITEVPVKKVNVDDDFAIATAYNVFSVPTVIALNDDGTEAGRFSGARDAQFVSRFIQSHTKE